MRTLYKGAVLLVFASCAAALAGCGGALQSLPAQSTAPILPGNVAPLSSTNAASQGMCAVYSGLGAVSFCHDMDEASGMTLLDGSGANHSGTTSASGVTYHAAGLTSNSSYAKTTNGSTGSMTSGFVPTTGSFSTTVFVSLRSNADNYGHLVATGDPFDGKNSTGWNIVLNNSTNNVFAKLGYGSGQTTIFGSAVALNTSTSITLTYNASTRVGTLCVGTASGKKCVSGTLPAAYVASGKPVVYGGTNGYKPANATFDEAAYWQGTVLTAAQMGTIASYAGGGGAPDPTPAPKVAFNDYTTFGYDNQRDVYNPNSTTLTPASLSSIHLAWQSTIGDYNTQGQPILATGISNHAGMLFLGGGSGKVYGIDALTGAKVWTRSTGQETYSCENGQTIYFGVGGAAAYDSASKSLYIIGNANASPNSKGTNTLLHLDGATGSILGQTNFAPTTVGTTDLDFSHTSVTLHNGLAYVGTSATCDISSWRGRVASVSVPSMRLANTFFTVWNGTTQPWGGGGIWGWGGVSLDQNGFVYTGVGNTDNGTTAHGSIEPPFKASPEEYSGLGDAFIKLSADLTTLQASNHPIPTSGFHGSSVDLDLQGTPAIFTPNGLGCPTIAALQGKSGTLFMYNTSNIRGGPIAKYQLAPSSYSDGFLGGPAYSAATGLLYAAVTSSGGSLYPPGMVAIDPGCGRPSIVWHTAFGPDSYPSGVPRSVPAVTAGGIIFVGTPCTPDSSNSCAGSAAAISRASNAAVAPAICCAPPGSGRGALWAIDASTGTVLNGGKPLIYTNAPLRAPPTVDGNWIFVLDNSGNMYALTIDPKYAAISTQTRPVDPRMLRTWEGQPREH